MQGNVKKGICFGNCKIQNKVTQKPISYKHAIKAVKGGKVHKPETLLVWMRFVCSVCIKVGYTLCNIYRIFFSAAFCLCIFF